MNLKKGLVSALALASILTFSTNITSINADEKANESTNIECPKEGPCKCKRANVFVESVNELNKCGVLSDEDVAKIKEFKNKEMEEKKQQMIEEKNKEIDEMANQNVITKEQATKLKETIQKNLEKNFKMKN
jgi:dTDP-glucose pyrophosphorylase